MVEEVGALIGLSYLAQDCLGLFRSSLFVTKGRTYKWLVTKLKAIDIIKTAARTAGDGGICFLVFDAL